MENELRILLIALSQEFNNLGLEYDARIVEGYISIEFEYGDELYALTAVLEDDFMQAPHDLELTVVREISDHLHAAAANARGIITQLVPMD